MIHVGNRHFKEYIKNIYIELAARHKGMGREAAANKFEDQLMDDFNVFSWMLESVFPNTKFNGEHYEFITNDNESHVHRTDSTKEINVGRITFVFNPKSCSFNVFFENKDFRHGQIDLRGVIGCTGGFNGEPSSKIVDIGISGVLMEYYAFAKISDHNTTLKGIFWN